MLAMECLGLVFVLRVGILVVVFVLRPVVLLQHHWYTAMTALTTTYESLSQRLFTTMSCILSQTSTWHRCIDNLVLCLPASVKQSTTYICRPPNLHLDSDVGLEEGEY